jgi:hypothetical protein
MEPEKFTNHLHNSIIDRSNDLLGTTTISSTEGLWSQIVNSNTYKTPAYLLEERLNKIELDNKLLKLKVLGLEGKFTQEEITNIRKMLMSEDEASKTLADSIIENA